MVGRKRGVSTDQQNRDKMEIISAGKINFRKYNEWIKLQCTWLNDKF